MNPRAEVPALIDGSFSLYDSTIICEYIEDRYPEPPLYPRDACARAKCRLLEDLADTQFDAATYAVAIIEHGRGERHPEMHEAAGRDVQRLFGELEQLLGAEAFFCGSYSLADIAVVPHIMAATFLGFALDPARHPRLVEWLDRVQERPALVRDNADVLATLQRLQEEQRPAFDPYRVQWRSDRLEWVIKNGFVDWLVDEMKADVPSSLSRSAAREGCLSHLMHAWSGRGTAPLQPDLAHRSSPAIPFARQRSSHSSGTSRTSGPTD